jgi:aminotransferase
MGYTETSVGLQLSELAPGVVQSEIRAMTMECDRIGGVNLAQGVCDTEVRRWWPRVRLRRFAVD